VTYSQAYGTLPTVTRENYVFDGWWTENNGTGTQILSSSIVSLTANSTLYAKWYRFYQVGEFGPAGGYIFYDKGSYSDGWRYMEAAPASYEYKYKPWGGSGIAVSGITWYYIGQGKENTDKIVAKFGTSEPSSNRSDYAAKLCADLSYTKDGIVYDDWFLPSRYELAFMYRNLKENNLGEFADTWYWSSSQDEHLFPSHEIDPDTAWTQNFSDGYACCHSRNSVPHVRPVRAF